MPPVSAPLAVIAAAPEPPTPALVVLDAADCPVVSPQPVMSKVITTKAIPMRMLASVRPLLPLGQRTARTSARTSELVGGQNHQYRRACARQRLVWEHPSRFERG